MIGAAAGATLALALANRRKNETSLRLGMQHKQSGVQVPAYTHCLCALHLLQGLNLPPLPTPVVSGSEPTGSERSRQVDNPLVLLRLSPQIAAALEAARKEYGEGLGPQLRLGPPALPFRRSG